jgi:hypothetical protein
MPHPYQGETLVITIWFECLSDDLQSLGLRKEASAGTWDEAVAYADANEPPDSGQWIAIDPDGDTYVWTSGQWERSNVD